MEPGGDLRQRKTLLITKIESALGGSTPLDNFQLDRINFVLITDIGELQTVPGSYCGGGIDLDGFSPYGWEISTIQVTAGVYKSETRISACLVTSKSRVRSRIRDSAGRLAVSRPLP